MTCTQFGMSTLWITRLFTTMDDESLTLEVQKHNIICDTKRLVRKERTWDLIAKVLDLDDTGIAGRTTPPGDGGRKDGPETQKGQLLLDGLPNKCSEDARQTDQCKSAVWHMHLNMG